MYSVNLPAIGFYLLIALVASGCAKLAKPTELHVATDAQWIILPISNESSNSLAGVNVQALLEPHLRARGISRLSSQVGTTKANLPVNQVVANGQDYAVTGSVSRWGYESGTGRGPEVQLQLQILDAKNGRVLWQARHLRKGLGPASLTSVANKVIGEMLAGVSLHYVSVPDVSLLDPVVGSSLPTALRSASKKSNDDLQTLQTTFSGKSMAFFYDANPPVAALAQFDRLVLEPDNIKAAELAEFLAAGVKPFAYQSMGEVGPNRAYASAIDPSWVIGSNTTWKSRVMDLTSHGWQNFLLGRVRALVAQGYTGLFLDTMDSYQLAATTEEERKQQELAMLELLSRIKTQHPGLELISNRGFEILEEAAPYLQAVAAESLYASWDNAKQQYKSVSAQDRQWLTAQLMNAKQQHGLDVIVIDYLPPKHRDDAMLTAQKIARQGFIPWVSTPGLDSIGVGLLEVMPREVLLLYDSADTDSIELSNVHTLVATPLEYLGYVPVYLDVDKDSLPRHILKGRYAGVVSWFTGNEQYSVEKSTELVKWIEQQIDDGVPIAMFGRLPVGLSAGLMSKMGIVDGAPLDRKSAIVAQRDSLVGFETELIPRLAALPSYQYSTNVGNTVHLRYIDARQHKLDLVLTGSWGGYALNPALVDVNLTTVPRWIINPYSFLESALKLADMPQPDVTTENGRRLWFAHIDGDALPSLAEMPGDRLGAEVIEERILDRFNLPHTISVVEGEMTGVRAYSLRRPRMFNVARRLFARDDVEIASHSYSHPYIWQKVSTSSTPGQYNLPIPGYRYSAVREVAGSVDFINRELAPEGKRTQVMLWSGDALPNEDALASAANNGLLNMNGGNTVITNSLNALSSVTPMVRPVGKQLQVYAPIMNENVFTNEWLGPFDGFRRVIETLALTDSPRRLKPANIYYHFYSGTKIASIKALEDVYEWSLSQDIMPVFGSYYIKKVPDFRQATVARFLDGSWKISSLGNIRSLRMRNKQLWPELASAQGVIGSRHLHDGVYLHTDGQESVTFRLSERPAGEHHLVSSNAVATDWKYNGGELQFRLTGNVPVEMELGGVASRLCQVITPLQRIKGAVTSRGTVKFTFPTLDTGNAILDCRT